MMRSSLFVVVVLLCCGRQETPVQEPEPTPEPEAPVELATWDASGLKGVPDAARAATKSIGPAGGELTATGADGTVFRLSIPRGALAAATDITVTPLAALEGLPTDVSLGAGVQFAPDGLTFEEPATLTATLPAAPAGDVLLLEYAGAGTDPARAVGRVTGTTLSASVSHFSGIASLEGEAKALQGVSARLLGDPLTSLAVGRIQSIAVNQADDPNFEGLLEETLVKNFHENIEPVLKDSSNDGFVFRGVRAYGMWLSLVQYAELLATRPLATAERAQAKELVAGALRAALGRVNTRLTTTKDWHDAQLALYWLATAEQLDLSTTAYQLDLESVTRNLALKLDVIAFNAQQEIGPTEWINVEATGSLTIGGVKVASPVLVADWSMPGALPDKSTGETDALGRSKVTVKLADRSPAINGSVDFSMRTTDLNLPIRKAKTFVVDGKLDLSLTAPSAAKNGESVDVTATLIKGRLPLVARNLDLAVSGGGTLSASQVPTVADGKATFKYTAPSSGSNLAVVSVTFNDTSTITKSVIIGYPNAGGGRLGTWIGTHTGVTCVDSSGNPKADPDAPAGGRAFMEILTDPDTTFSIHISLDGVNLVTGGTLSTAWQAATFSGSTVSWNGASMNVTQATLGRPRFVEVTGRVTITGTMSNGVFTGAIDGNHNACGTFHTTFTATQQ